MKLSEEYGRENVKIFCRWEKYDRKMADFTNHRRFTLRCLSKGLVPVSICLTKNIRTPRGLQIIKRAERALMNERIRSINNTLNMVSNLRDTCENQLREVLSNEWMGKCREFIEVRRENQHLKTLERQKIKFERLLGKEKVREGDCITSCGGHDGYHSNLTNQNNTIEESNRRENTWVNNLSSNPLTQDEMKLLANGPNYAIVPRIPPIGEYITTIENVCNQLEQGKVEELRGEVKKVLKKVHPPRPNISRDERKAIEQLRKDKTRVILTADKGVSMVVMDRDDYNSKAEDLLHQQTYGLIPSDPTNKLKNKLITLLKKIKTEGGLSEATYKRLYPTGAGSPKFYGLPKVHKQGTPLRPIVSSIGAATYQIAKELSRILKPLVGRSKHHIHNNQDFIQDLKSIQLASDEVMMSFDVKALFTSVPIEPALKIIEKLLKEDHSLQSRTTMSIQHIMDLLGLCLRSTYFTFRGKFYEQVEGAAMGSPISPIVANLYMEEFETRAIQSSPNPPLLWRRFVDDTFVIMKKCHREEFLQHLNSVDKNIQFTAEEPGTEGALPFLDLLIKTDQEGRLHTTVYRKPTHTDQYLHWDSLHPVSSKYSVVGTLHHRANTICSDQQLLKEEEDHLTKALMKCKYPRWALNRVKIKMNCTAHKNKNKARPTQQNITPRPHITVPYYRGLSESIKQRCRNYGVQVYFRGGTTIKNLLMAPKDLDPMMKKSGAIYSYKCGRVECNEKYIGESSRTFEERFKEHQKTPSPIFDHFNITGHSISVEHFNIVVREDQNLKRAIKEALYIRVNNPSLNRNVGKCHLPHIWDEVLYNIPELKLK